MKNLAFFLLIVITGLPLYADIREGELSGYKSLFLKKIISNNPDKESEIRRCLEGLIKDGSSGVRIIDRFGLFLYDSRNNGLTLEKIKYFHDGQKNLFMITLKDSADSGLYNLFLEYSYDSGRGAFRLSDISFSMVYADRIKSVTEFFGGS